MCVCVSQCLFVCVCYAAGGGHDGASTNLGLDTSQYTTS